MKDWQSQAHVKWDCKYHVVILPKYRRKVLYGRMRRGVGQILRDLCRQKDIELVEGKAMPDHIHMLLSVPPRYSIAMTIGYLKGKSATRIHRELLHTKGTLFGRSFWARGYCVSTVGLDEDRISSAFRVRIKRIASGDIDSQCGDRAGDTAVRGGRSAVDPYPPLHRFFHPIEWRSCRWGAHSLGRSRPGIRGAVSDQPAASRRAGFRSGHSHRPERAA